MSKQALDQYQAAVVEAEARVDAQKKSLEVYRLNKEFTHIVSPINGQVSRYYLTLGNLVNQDQTLLTTIVSLDPMYAYFDMDERTLLQIRKAIAEGKITAPADGDIPVLLGLQNEEGFPHQGNDQLRQQPGELHDGKHHDARRVRQPQAASRGQGSSAAGAKAASAAKASACRSAPRHCRRGYFRPACSCACGCRSASRTRRCWSSIGPSSPIRA